MKSIRLIPFLILGFLPLMSCFNSETERTSALVNFILIDAPGDFDAVFIEVLGVECRPAGTRGQDNANNVFFPYNSSNKEVEVSRMVAGDRVLIGRGEVGVGLLSSVTLRLGDEHFVELNGTRIQLPFSSGASNEVQIDTDFVLEPGISYDILIDFDVARSVRRTAVNTFEMNPMVRVFYRLNTGEIRGRVTPVAARPNVYAIQGQDTLSTGINPANGDYLFMGLNNGTYTLVFEPLSTHLDTLFTVPVLVERTTEVDPFVLREVDGQVPGEDEDIDGDDDEEDDPDEDG